MCPKTFVHEFYWCCLGGGGGGPLGRLFFFLWGGGGGGGSTMDIVLLFCRRVSNLCESMPAGTLSLGPGYSHIAY